MAADPNDANVVFFTLSDGGTGAGGVCRFDTTNGSNACTSGAPFANQGFLRLAVAATAVPTTVFVATWATTNALSGVFTTQSFPSFSANVFSGSVDHLGGDGGAGRVGALATNNSGTTVLVAGVGMARGTFSGSWSWNDVDVDLGNPNHWHLHGDYHSIRYDANGYAYAVTDGGYFHSWDGGSTWTK